jgi:hypothetical protein
MRRKYTSHRAFEIWDFDVNRAGLTDRRLFQNWGWINEYLFRKKELRMTEK